MKSITVHGIDERTEKLIKKRAKSEGRSVNKVMKGLLAEALGIDKNKQDKREEFLATTLPACVRCLLTHSAVGCPVTHRYGIR